MAHNTSNVVAKNSKDSCKNIIDANNDDEVKASTVTSTTTFHDFLGKGCSSSSPATGRQPSARGAAEASPSASSGGGRGPISTTSDLGSERNAGNHLEGVPYYGSRVEFTLAETSNKFVGTKRSNSDSFMGSSREKYPPIQLDSAESSHFMKLLRNAGAERPRRPHEEEISFGMHPLRPIPASLISQPCAGGKADTSNARGDRALPVNVGPILQYPPRGSQIVPFGYQAPSNKFRDATAGPSVLSQAAADEGSRTGIKGSGILSSINANGGILERNLSGTLLSGGKQKSGIQVPEPESSTALSRQGSASSGRQMTIFYAGQAHVFDNVHPNKADVIMALAGSNGGSWSTTYAPKSAGATLNGESSAPRGENDTGTSSNFALQKDLQRTPSFRGNSTHGFGSGDQVSVLRGIHPGGITIKETQTTLQASQRSGEGKRDA